MKTIVMNTTTGSVSEYELPFQSLTPDFGGDVTGLYRLGGDTDNGVPITATMETGRTHWGDARKRFAKSVYLSMSGQGEMQGLVASDSSTYEYRFSIRSMRESRFTPGKGIRETYLSFGIRNIDGANFSLDRLEVLSPQSKRRV